MNGFGINGTGDGEVTPDSIIAIGRPYVRVVLLQRFDLNDYIDACHTNGIGVLGVIARESLGIAPSLEKWNYSKWVNSITGRAHKLTAFRASNGELSYDDAARLYASRYGDKLDLLQVGNEADHVSPSSWTLSTDSLNSLLAAFRGRFSATTKMVGPGLVSGDANWVRGIDTRLLDFLAVHGYGQRPWGSELDWAGLPGNFGVITDLMKRYEDVSGLPTMATEIGISTNEASLNLQAAYCEEIMKALQGRFPFWFCMGDWMVDGFGLYSGDGTVKPAALTYTRAVSVMFPPPFPKPGPSPEPPPTPPPPEPPKPPEPPMPEQITIPEASYRAWWTALRPHAAYNPGSGFETLWRQRMSELGPTLDDTEWQDGGYNWRTFERGALRWSASRGVEMVGKP